MPKLRPRFRCEIQILWNLWAALHIRHAIHQSGSVELQQVQERESFEVLVLRHMWKIEAVEPHPAGLIFEEFQVGLGCHFELCAFGLPWLRQQAISEHQHQHVLHPVREIDGGSARAPACDPHDDPTIGQIHRQTVHLLHAMWRKIACRCEILHPMWTKARLAYA